MRDEDFLPDFRPDTVWTGCFMGIMCSLMPFAFVAEGRAPELPTYIASAMILAATLGWLIYHLGKRGSGYLLAERAIERIEHGVTTWNLGWKNVVALPKGSRVEIQDLTGHTWGRITLDLSTKNSYGRKGRVLFARLLANAARVDWRLPSLAERRRRYLVVGSSLAGVGLLMTVPSCIRVGLMFAEAEQGIWNRGPNAAAILALFVGLCALMLGVVDLNHLRTDRTETASEPEHVTEFLARPVPVAAEMAPGVWHHYRDAQRARASWTMQLRLLMWFFGGFLLLTPLGAIIGSRFREEPLQLIDLLGIEAMIVASMLSMRGLILFVVRPLSHRFRRVGDFLEVDTGEEIKRYPWDSAKDKMVKTRGSSWMSGYTTFGKGLRTYNLDRCWIEPEEDVHHQAT